MVITILYYFLQLRRGDAHSTSWVLASEILNWPHWNESFFPDYGTSNAVVCSSLLRVAKKMVEKEGDGIPENIRFVFWFDN